MKRIIIGALVGGIIIFICQTLSWTILDLHRPANQFTPKQDEIMTYLNGQFSEDGSYLMPGTAPGASSEVMEQHMKAAAGKPWAVVAYHKVQDANMVMNIFRGLIVDILMVGLFCWILSRFANPRFSNVFIASILTGLVVFLNVPYTTHIWFKTFDLGAFLIDSIVGWGLAGIWLGWWYGRTNKVSVTLK